MCVLRPARLKSCRKIDKLAIAQLKKRVQMFGVLQPTYVDNSLYSKPKDFSNTSSIYVCGAIVQDY